MKGLLFTYALTYGGFIVSLFKPFYGVLVYVCFALLKPEELWQWSVPPGHYSRIIAAGFLIGWAIHGFGSWRMGQGRATVIALCGFSCCAVLSAIWAPDQVVAWNYIDALSKIVAPFLVGITTINSVKELKQLTWVLVLCIGYIAYNENYKYFQGWVIERDNMLAHMLVLGACPGFFLGLYSSRWWQKATGFLCAALMMHAVLIHMSRGAMLGLCVSMLVTFLLMPKRPRHIIVFGLAVALALRGAGPEVQERFWTTFASQEERDTSAQSRLDLWNNMSSEIQAHPILGLGPGHWPLVAIRYGWPEGKEGHSLWVQAAAEVGIPGLVFLFLFYVFCVVRLMRWSKRYGASAEPWLNMFSVMIVASLLGFILEAQFGSFVRMEAPYYLALIGAGTLKLRSQESLLPRHDSSLLGHPA